MTTKSKLLISTSREPTKEMRSFSHDLTRCVPSSIYLNRGKLSIYGLAEKALEYESDRVMILSRWKGHLGKIELYRIGATGLIPFPPLVYVTKIKLQREFGRKKKIGRIKSLTTTLSTKTSTETKKAAESFSDFFRLPLLLVDQAVLNKYSACMHFSLDPSKHTEITFLFLPSKIEFGPRITVSHLVTELKN
jgi:rRNA maturation protein Rpf1